MKINKKAVMEDFLQLVAWLIVIVVVFFIFTGVKAVKTQSLIDQSKEIEMETDTNYLLIDFLNQKTENPDAENMAELIALYYETKDEKIFGEVKEKTEDFFSKSFLQTVDSLWEFKILDKEKNEIKSIGGLVDLQIKEKDMVLSSIILPVSKENDDYIIIEIHLIEIMEAFGSI